MVLFNINFGCDFVLDIEGFDIFSHFYQWLIRYDLFWIRGKVWVWMGLLECILVFHCLLPELSILGNSGWLCDLCDFPFTVLVWRFGVFHKYFRNSGMGYFCSIHGSAWQILAEYRFFNYPWNFGLSFGPRCTSFPMRVLYLSDCSCCWLDSPSMLH